MNTTPSANAAKIIAAVRIGPEAPGLRPVASAAFAPTIPTPMAEPSAARPTCKLPLSAANISICFFSYLVAPTIQHGLTTKSVLSVCVVLVVMAAHQRGEHRSQQGKNKCLHEADQ